MNNNLNKKGKSELKEALFSLKKAFFFVGFFSFFTNLLMLVPALYMLQLYDRVVHSRSVDTLILLTIIVVILFITLGLLEIIRSRVLVRIGNKFDSLLSERIFVTLFRLSNKFPSKASTQPISDLTQIRQYMTSYGVFGFFDSPWIPIYIGVLFLFHPLFGYFSIFAAIVLLIITIINEMLTKEKLEEANSLMRESNRFADAKLRNAEVVNAMGMIENIKRKWQQKYYKFLKAQSDASEKAGVWANISKSLRIMFQSLILGLGGYLAIKMEISPGMMIAGSIIMGRALAPLDLLTNSWKQFKGAKISYERLTALLNDFPKEKEYMKLPEPKGEILLEGVTIVPPNAKEPAVIQVSMKIEKGEIVGIIGHSAAGKSSLARGILGIWPLYQGVVRLDGADIKQWKREDLGKFIGYLPQDIELFEGTVSENIARFGELDTTKIVSAAMDAGVHEMILRLPDGYDTIIGVGGATLSGGQRQRIGLARAIYDNPILVVLDEPNSNLDEAGELALLKTIQKLKSKGTTVILITHRSNILQGTTKIAMMRNGLVKIYDDSAKVLKALQVVEKENEQVKRETMQKTAQKEKSRAKPTISKPTISLSKPGE